MTALVKLLFLILKTEEDTTDTLSESRQFCLNSDTLSELKEEEERIECIEIFI